MNNSQLGNFWIFREGRKQAVGQTFVKGLLRAIDEVLHHHITRDRIVNALVIAGQLESALGDMNSASAGIFERATDSLAALLLSGDETFDALPQIKRELANAPVPERIEISPPEGFAYYALHPSDFARMTEQLPERSGPIAVVGIRSIGTTLGAVVAAALRRKGRLTERITVRPVGHPYNRVVEFSPEQSAWVASQISREADFLVVDEGPGRSGSSFLCVAEALVRAGARFERITLLGSRGADPGELCADNARQRWSQFRFLAPVLGTYERFRNDFYIGGGEWRNFFEPHASWPECWPQMERLKFLSVDRRQLFKFEGFGPFGKHVLARAAALSDSCFGPAAEDAGDGMICYSVMEGRRPARCDVSPDLLKQIATYCAFRNREFRCQEIGSHKLGDMARFNLQAHFGDDVEFPPELLETASPVLVDGRMQPHEWVLLSNERLIKLDGASHGDDHFFPGPTDIAWDLAGTIVEWRLDQSATDLLLTSFLRASGDDVRGRIEPFVLAYAIFRLGYCGMASTTVGGTPEEARLKRACEKYSGFAAAHLSNTAANQNRIAPPTLDKTDFLAGARQDITDCG